MKHTGVRFCVYQLEHCIFGPPQANVTSMEAVFEANGAGEIVFPLREHWPHCSTVDMGMLVDLKNVYARLDQCLCSYTTRRKWKRTVPQEGCVVCALNICPLHIMGCITLQRRAGC